MSRIRDMRVLLLTLFATLSISATPVVSTISPASGLTTGGTYVYITGEDLTGLNLACPTLECSNYVRFGDSLGYIIVNTSTQIVAIAPPHTAGSVNLVVNIAGKGQAVIANGFLYQQPKDTDEERFLLPIIVDGLGAFGSVWRTTVTMYNAGDARLTPNAPICNPLILAPCPILVIEPHQTVRPKLYAPLYPQLTAPGATVRVPRALADNLDIQIRVRDMSRESQTWGTELPVVRERDYRPVVRLHDVPTDSHFRTTLRMYGYDNSPFPIDVRVYDETAAHNLIASAIVDKVALPDGTTYAQINSLAETFPQISSYETVSVEVESSFTPRPPMWALASVTNNDTQHVTIITPHP